MPHFRRALELASNAAERAGWWVDLARAAVRVGALDELRSVVENSAREDLPPGARARIAADDAMGWLTRRERELARSRGTEALALAEAAGEAEAEGTAAQVLAYVALEERDVERAEVFTRRATAAFERAGRPRYTWAMGLNVSLLRAQRKTEEALALLATGIAAARVAGDRAFVGELHFQLGFLQVKPVGGKQPFALMKPRLKMHWKIPVLSIWRFRLVDSPFSSASPATCALPSEMLLRQSGCADLIGQG